MLEPFARRSEFANHGQRVVDGQRLMQAASDIFLGWLRNKDGLDGEQRDFYVRQLQDWKASAEIEQMVPDGMTDVRRGCAAGRWRGPTRAPGDRIAIAAYLGNGDVFDRAVADFSSAYADQNVRDHQALAAAVENGRLQAVSGV